MAVNAGNIACQIANRPLSGLTGRGAQLAAGRAFISAHPVRRLPAPAKVIRRNCGLNRKRHPQPGWCRTARRYLAAPPGQDDRSCRGERCLGTCWQLEPASNLALSANNLTIVIVVAAVALLALAVAGGLVREVLAADQGTERMQNIARAVQEGAAAYLTRQFRTLAIFVVMIPFLLLLLPGETDVRDRPLDLLRGRCGVLRPDRLHGHVAGRARKRPRRRRRP